MTTELVSIKTTAVQLFQENGLDPILDGIKKKIEDFKSDVSTPKGRKEITSFAYKIAQSKTFIDKAGKDLVAKQKADIKKIDAERKRSRDWLDAKKVEVKKPLDDWNAAEAKRVEDERLIKEYCLDYDEAISENELIDRERSIAEKEAEFIRQEKELLKKAEAERVEKERIENEARIKDEAELKAKIEAEEKIQAERDAKEKAERDAKEAAEKAIRDAQELAERTERERIAAEERAKIEKEMAIRKATEDAEAKASAEREAEEKETSRLKEIADKKAANTKHQAGINNLILTGLTDFGMDEESARHLTIHIAKGGIPKLRIEY